MRRANVYCRGVLAGLLTHDDGRYRFHYVPEYLRDAAQPAIRLTLPKREAAYCRGCRKRLFDGKNFAVEFRTTRR